MVETRALIRNQARMPLPALLLNLALEVLAHAVRQEKPRYSTDGEERSKTVFAHRGHDCPCRKYERINKKLLEPKSNYDKIGGYKVIIQNQLLSYMQTMNKWILKLKTQYHFH